MPSVPCDEFNESVASFFRLSNGGEYLFQSHDDGEMQAWVSAINSAAGAASAAEGAEGGRAQTLPASGEAKKKSGGFFTLKGKK